MKADRIVVPGNGVKEDLEKYFELDHEKIEVVYNGYQKEAIQELSKEVMEELQAGIFSAGNSIISIGRLTKQKGQWHLIRAFSELKRTVPGSKLIILGEGNLRDYLVQLSRDCGNEVYCVWNGEDERIESSDILFLGFQKNPFKYIKRSSLFALPSLWEGLPNIVMEALHCGVPVIASDCRAGPREVLAPETDYRKEATTLEFAEYGILMPEFDGRFYSARDPLTKAEKSWVDVLAMVLTDDALRERYRERSAVRALDFTLERNRKQWLGVVDTVLKA